MPYQTPVTPYQTPVTERVEFSHVINISDYYHLGADGFSDVVLVLL